jgi:predicted nucleotidyltransferase
MESQHPTPYPEINALLHDVLVSAREILGSHFVGLYLEGSLASDDFDQDSDIDFVVVTDEDVSDQQFAALRAMHDRIASIDSWYAVQLEGSYISRHALRRHDPARALHPNIERGPGERLKMAYHDSAWQVHRAIMRERGVTLAGPDPRTLIDPLAPEDLRRAMVEPLHGWAASFFGDPAQLHVRGYQSYVVLTMCRMLYTLQTGRVATKPVAARWALRTLDARWVPLIERAWEGRHNPDAEHAAEGARWAPLIAGARKGPRSVVVLPDDLSETLEFIRYAIECSQAWQ